MRLTYKQTTALDYLQDNKTTELLFGGGAGGGKSALGCYWQIKNRLKYPGTRGLIGRAVLKTLKDTTLNTFFQIAGMQGLRAGWHYVYNQQRNIIYFPPTESEILLKDLAYYPSDPNFDELGSLEITDAFVDETNQITKKAWNVTKSRIRYKLDDYGIVPKMLGTCNPAKNWTYSDFYKPDSNGTLPDNRKFIQSLLSDNPYVSKHYRENLLGLDKNSLERLLNGNWEYDDDPAVLMSITAIYNLFNRKDLIGGARYISVDVARYGQDTTRIIYWNGLKAEYMITLEGKDTSFVAKTVHELAIEKSVPIVNIVIDEDGVGGGVVDQVNLLMSVEGGAKCVGFVNNSSPLNKENFNNLKSQCYFKLADLVNKGLVAILCVESDDRDLLVQELEQVKQWKMDHDMKKQIVPKDVVKELIGRSPDISDAVMMRMYFEIKPMIEEFEFGAA